MNVLSIFSFIPCKVMTKTVENIEVKASSKSSPAARVEEGVPKRSSTPATTPAPLPKKSESNAPTEPKVRKG